MSEILYFKCRKLKCHGLQGFEWRYLKGGTVYVNGSVYVVSEHKKHDGLPEMYSAKNSKSITKQEYQEATGDYTCDIDESKKPVPPTCREVKNTMPIEALFGISIGLILLMVISLCAN